MSKSYKKTKWYDRFEDEDGDYKSRKTNDRRKDKKMRRALKTRNIEYFTQGDEE